MGTCVSTSIAVIVSLFRLLFAPEGLGWALEVEGGGKLNMLLSLWLLLWVEASNDWSTRARARLCRRNRSASSSIARTSRSTSASECDTPCSSSNKREDVEGFRGMVWRDWECEGGLVDRDELAGGWESARNFLEGGLL